jgi:hypothetical protein
MADAAAAPLPLVFIHQRNSPYLGHTLAQARAWSPASPIYLIGDDSNAGAHPFVTHVNMARYASSATAFRNVYRHFSPNGEAYELFCFLRWFYLRDFLRESGLERIVHVDSDVLLYVDVNREQVNWYGYDLTLVRGYCAGNMFVNRRRAIEDLCDVIWDLYAASGAQDRLAAIYARRQETGEGISDMVPLKMLYDARRDRVAEMTGLRPDGSWWDANIHLGEGFETQDGRKRVTFHDGRAYCRHIESGGDVRLNCLHFQGGAKRHIEPAYRAGLASVARAA